MDSPAHVPAKACCGLIRDGYRFAEKGHAQGEAAATTGIELK
jgi:hypothetical protein